MEQINNVWFFRSRDMAYNNSGVAGLLGWYLTRIVGGATVMEHCRKAVEQLVGGKQEQIVLFGGTSAGGRGSMVEFIINC